MVVTCSSETSVYNKPTWSHIPEDSILLILICNNQEWIFFNLNNTHTNNYNQISIPKSQHSEINNILDWREIQTFDGHLLLAKLEWNFNLKLQRFARNSTK
jgi:hypothetical protein